MVRSLGEKPRFASAESGPVRCSVYRAPKMGAERGPRSRSPALVVRYPPKMPGACDVSRNRNGEGTVWAWSTPGSSVQKPSVRSLTMRMSVCRTPGKSGPGCRPGPATPRSYPPGRGRRKNPSAAPDPTPAGASLVHAEVPSGHLGGELETKHPQDRWSDVTECAVAQPLRRSLAGHVDQHDPDWIGGVRRMRPVRLRIPHLFAVAMVGGDQDCGIRRRARLEHPPELLVDGFHGPDRGLQHPGMADHVRIGIVADEQVVLLRFQRREQHVRDSRRTHLRLLVVGGYLGRGHHLPPSPFLGSSTPPLKK